MRLYSSENIDQIKFVAKHRTRHETTWTTQLGQEKFQLGPAGKSRQTRRTGIKVSWHTGECWKWMWGEIRFTQHCFNFPWNWKETELFSAKQKEESILSIVRSLISLPEKISNKAKVHQAKDSVADQQLDVPSFPNMSMGCLLSQKCPLHKPGQKLGIGGESTHDETTEQCTAMVAKAHFLSLNKCHRYETNFSSERERFSNPY